MLVMKKSITGLPPARFPRGIDLPAEARKARRRLYPVSALYSVYSLAVVAAALLISRRPAVVALSYTLGAVGWTYLEYLVHRHILHGVFPERRGAFSLFLHRYFDHLHWEHHARPWDGNHINGTTRDTLPFLIVLGGLSFLAPIETVPVFLAGVIQFYILEEWVHHSVHFYRFHGPYFRYIKKHHLYHHSPRGPEVAYGLTNGFWDRALHTRIPEADRRLLYGSPPPSVSA